MSAAPLLVEETAAAELSEESPTSDYLEELPEAPAAAPAGPRTAAVAVDTGRNGGYRTPQQVTGGFNFGKPKRHPPHLPYNPKVQVKFMWPI